MAIAYYGKSTKDNAFMDIQDTVVLVVDKDEDINGLPFGLPVGSVAYVIESEDKWMMNAEGSWQKCGTTSTIDPPADEEAPADEGAGE